MKHTKHKLLSSIATLFVCLAMFIGSTYAWFTDSASTGVNKIQAGNLDIEVKHSSSSITEPETIQDKTDLFRDTSGNAMLWEPGAISWEKFTVSNEGNLALKYQLKMNASNYNKVVLSDGTITDRTLLDVLKVCILDGNEAENFIATRSYLESLTYSYSLMDFLKEGHLDPKTVSNTDVDTYVVAIYWEPTEKDNDYNLNNGKYASDSTAAEVGKLSIDLGIQVNATQYTYEEDSFDNQYDVNASLPALVNSYIKPNSNNQLDDVVLQAGRVSSGSNLVEVKVPVSQNNNNGQVIKATTTAGEKIIAAGDSLNLKVESIDEIDSTIQITSEQGSDNYEITLTDQEGNKITSTSENIEIRIYVGNKTVTNVYHNATVVDYTIDNGYVVINTDSFSPFTIVYASPVARVGDTNYGSLREALDVAVSSSSSTVELLRDVDFDGANWTPFLVPKNVSLTINGNGHTIKNAVVGDYFKDADGTWVGGIGTGSQATYMCAFIGNNEGELVINDLNFDNFNVDMNVKEIPTSQGSSQIGVVLGANNGTKAEINNVNVSNSVVKGYTKVAIICGHDQKNNIKINHTSIIGCEVVLEADGKDPDAALSGIIIGYGAKKLSTNGIKLENNKMTIDESVKWEGYTRTTSSDGTIKAGSWGLMSATYSTNTYGNNSVKFVEYVDGYGYETANQAAAARQ